jgi:hypothetical protein
MVSRGVRFLSLVAFSAAALAAAAAFSSIATTPFSGAGLALEVTPVPLDAADPSRSAVGPLRYLGGLWLRSDDPRFGGLSDLRVSPDGVRLFAVSDCGRGFTASLSYDAGGRLTGLADPRLTDLESPTGARLGAGEIDAESLVRGEAGLEVGFEGRGRVQAYAALPAFGGSARVLDSPPGLELCGRNGGLETMANTADGRRLLVCETRRSSSTTVPAWVGRGQDWTPREYPLAFEGGWAGEPFRPTGAALLPDGDLLVVERRFPPIGARLVRLPRANVESTGALAPLEVARLESPLTLDNFEGVEARRDTSGRTLVYLLSDDNGCAKVPGARRSGLQRTLLLLFALEG